VTSISIVGSSTGVVTVGDELLDGLYIAPLFRYNQLFPGHFGSVKTEKLLDWRKKNRHIKGGF